MSLEEKFKKFVNGYVGSSMLTNTEYPETIEANAKQCVQICDEFAIGFGEFLKEKCTPMSEFNKWYFDGSYYTLPELLEIYKQGL